LYFFQGESGGFPSCHIDKPILRGTAMPIEFTSTVMRLQYIEREILRRLAKIGGKPAKSDRGWQAIDLQGQNIEYSCREKHRHVRRILTAEEMRWHVPGSKNWKQELEPTGILTFEITSYSPDRLQKSWRDTDARRLEDCILEIIAAFPKVAAAMIERDRKWQEENERQRLLEAQRVEERTRKERDKNRWDRFLQIASERKDILMAEEYLSALKARVTAFDRTIGEKSVSSWIGWAEAKVIEWKSRNENPERVFEIIDWVSTNEKPRPFDRR
jgi:hypothetical protein